MITPEMGLPRGVSLDDLFGGSSSGLRDGSPDGSEFAAMLQQMSSQQEQQQRRSDLSGLVGAQAASPVLELAAGATRLSEAGVKSLVHILWTAVMSGKETAEVGVQPREMGTLVLNIKVVDDGVYVEALADDPRVVSLIRASILELADGLARRGLILRGLSTSINGPPDDRGAEHDEARAEDPSEPEDTKKHIDAQRRSFIEVVI